MMRTALLLLILLTTSVCRASERDDLKLLSELTASIRDSNSVALLLALAGEKKEAIENIFDDVLKRAAGKRLPGISLQGKDFYLDGKKTGLSIIGLRPFKLLYKNRVWTAKAGQSADKRYFEIVDFLSSKEKHAFLSFLPSAEAAEFGREITDGASIGSEIGSEVGSVVGAIAGGIGGVVLSAILAPSGPLGWLVGTGITLAGIGIGERVGKGAGFLIGGSLGTFVGAEAEVASSAIKIAGHVAKNAGTKESKAAKCVDIEVRCDDVGVSIKPKDPTKKGETIARRHPAASELELVMTGPKGEDMTPKDKDARHVLAQAILKCQTEADAKAATAKVNEACATVSSLAKDQPAAAEGNGTGTP